MGSWLRWTSGQGRVAGGSLLILRLAAIPCIHYNICSTTIVAGRPRAGSSIPAFFPRLAQQQSPQYLWIGCSDSRVSATAIIGLDPGEVFVHRNVANLVVHTDVNCLTVLQYAVDVLRVQHVIVCGHYGCGGVLAAMSDQPHGLIDNWLRNIKDIYYDHAAELEAIVDVGARTDRLCELNVVQQVANVCHTTMVQDAWQRGQPVAVHGWIYGLHDGCIHDLGRDDRAARADSFALPHGAARVAFAACPGSRNRSVGRQVGLSVLAPGT
jgi:carbonic anhydrase